MRIKFDVRGLRRLAQGLGWGLLAGIAVAVAYIGLSWLLVQWLGWVGGILSLLLFVALVLASDFVKFERKDQGQEVQWRVSKPGRRTDPFYDAAFELITSGEKTEAEARAWYFEQTGKKGDKYDIKNFNKAVKERKEQRLEGTK